MEANIGPRTPREKLLAEISYLRGYQQGLSEGAKVTTAGLIEMRTQSLIRIDKAAATEKGEIQK